MDKVRKFLYNINRERERERERKRERKVKNGILCGYFVWIVDLAFGNGLGKVYELYWRRYNRTRNYYKFNSVYFLEFLLRGNNFYSGFVFWFRGDNFPGTYHFSVLKC